MHYRWTAVVAVLGIFLLGIVTSCTPDEVALWQSLKSKQSHPTLVCIRRHESDTAGGYRAENPSSTASGAYQFLDSTWRNVSVRSGNPGYARASQAPWWVQDDVALWVINHGGKSAWRGTGC
jgi:muramidase (phage lysozyme)